MFRLTQGLGRFRLADIFFLQLPDQLAPSTAPAVQSKLFTLLRQPDGHRGVHLDDDSFERLATWIDVYAQKLDSFSQEQEQELSEFRRNIRSLLAE
ncbi:MAG: hypothetical protein ABUJ92_12720 [Desulfobacterales bacterium]